MASPEDIRQLREEQQRLRRMLEEIDQKIGNLAEEKPQEEKTPKDPAAIGSNPPPLIAKTEEEKPEASSPSIQKEPDLPPLSSRTDKPSSKGESLKPEDAPAEHPHRLQSKRPWVQGDGPTEPTEDKPQAPSSKGDSLSPADAPAEHPHRLQSKRPWVQGDGPAESLEMRIGTYWFVRIGVVLLITGLGFLAHYAYFNLWFELGPLGRLFLLYLGSGALTWFGFRLERSGEKMVNFARVVMAGGFAALYYTTYSAHYSEHVRVIPSPIFAGVLLLGLAAWMTWVSVRRDSQPLAVMVFLLAFYATILQQVESFTLFSQLVLCAAAVFLLLRKGWASVSFVAVTATYIGYFYWRLIVEQNHDWDSTFDFSLATAYLSLSWALFTFAAFAAAPTILSQGARTTLMAMNTAGFFLLAAVNIDMYSEGYIWQFAFCLGVVKLALAVTAQKVRPNENIFSSSLVLEGILLVLLGVILHFRGETLPLILSIMSTILLIGGRVNIAIRIGSAIAALLAALTVLPPIVKDENALTGFSVALLMLANASWLHFGDLKEGRTGFRLRVGFYTLLGFFILLLSISYTLDEAFRTTSLCLFATALILTLPQHRCREFSWGGHALMAIGVLSFLVHLADHHITRATALPPVLIYLILAAAYRPLLSQMPGKPARSILALVGSVYSYVGMLLLFIWTMEYGHRSERTIIFALASITALGVACRLAPYTAMNWSGIMAILTNLHFLALSRPEYITSLPAFLALLLLAAHQVGARYLLRHDHPVWQWALSLLLTLSLWRYLHVWAQESGPGVDSITLIWFLYGTALLVAGLVMFQRPYRYAALFVMGTALLRLFLFDVWELERIFQILSFIAAGIILVAAGLFYTKYQDKIRPWL